MKGGNAISRIDKGSLYVEYMKAYYTWEIWEIDDEQFYGNWWCCVVVIREKKHKYV